MYIYILYIYVRITSIYIYIYLYIDVVRYCNVQRPVNMRDEQLTTVRYATGAELISAMMGVTNGIALAVIGLEPGWSW